MYLYVLNPQLISRFREKGYTFVKEEQVGGYLVPVFKNNGEPFAWPLLSVIQTNELSFETPLRKEVGK